MSYPLVPLGELCILNPPAPSRAEQTGMATFVPMSAVSETGHIATDLRRSLTDYVGGLSYFQTGDVLVAKITPCFENNKIAIVQLPTEHGLGSTEFHVLRPDRTLLDGRYLMHFLRQDEIRQIGSRRMTGSVGQRRVPAAFLRDLRIPLPSIAEQRVLARAFDRASRTCSLTLDASQYLDDLASSAFDELFGDPASNPRRFEKARLGDIINFIGGSQPPKTTFSTENRPGMVRLVQIRDFRTDRYKTYVPRHLARRFFEEDDVMIGRYGPPVFQIFRGLSGAYNVALMKAEPKGEILKDFVYYLLQHEQLRQHIVAKSERTAGQSGVNLDVLNAYPAFKPPIELQRRFSSLLRNIENAKRLSQQRHSFASELFISLLHQGFANELDFSTLTAAP